MSNRHIAYLLLAIVGVTAASAIVHYSDTSDKAASASTYSVHPRGCKGLYLLLEKLQLPVERFRQSYRRLDRVSGTLLVIDPRAVAFERDDVTRLEQWIKKGNRLVLFQAPSRGSGDKTGKSGKNHEASGKESRTDRLSLARRLGLRFTRLQADGRSTCTVSTPLLKQVHELNVSEAARWEGPPEGWDTLVADAAGPLVVAKHLGSGEILAVADPSMVENGFLGKAQNARLAVALIGREKLHQTILFDEYHHGYLLQESFWHYAGASVFAWILFQSAVGFLLFIYSRRAAQAGRFQSLEAPKGRSSVEYVDSMANVLSSCKAGSVALEMLLRRFLGRVSRQRGVPLKLAAPGTADQRTMQAILDPEAADLVNRCTRAIESDADVGSALRLARELQRTSSGSPGTRQAGTLARGKPSGSSGVRLAS